MKKVILLFAGIIVILILSVNVFADNPSTGIEVTRYYRGDMDGNGTYTMRDGLSILKYIAELEAESDEKLGDINLDGTVSAEDALFMMNMLITNRGEYGTYVYEKPSDNVIIIDNMAVPIGNYCFKTLDSAIKYVNANPPIDESERITMYISPGTYRERTNLTAPYITLANMNPEDKVNISFYYVCGGFYYSIQNGTLAARARDATFYIDKNADCFNAYNIRFENTYNLEITDEERLDMTTSVNNKESLDRINSGDPTFVQIQALAVMTTADKTCFYNCEMIGRQDTLLLSEAGKRAYLKDCYIEGTVDYVYGASTAVFDNCIFNCPYGGGYVTAASTEESQKYGFLLLNCTITKNNTSKYKEAPSDGTYSLGRPWRQGAMVVYANCRMDKHIKINKDRFTGMSDATAANARYFEVGSMDMSGNKIDLDAMLASWKLSDNELSEHVLKEDDIAPDGEYAPWKWLWGDDEWNPGGYDLK